MATKVGLREMRLVVEPWTEATRILEETRRRHPRYADQRHLLGLLYMSQGNPGAAIREFDAALEVNPGYPAARFHRLFALRQRDGFLDASLWNEQGPMPMASEPERSLWSAWYCGQRGDREGARCALAGLAVQEGGGALARFVQAIYCAGWGEESEAHRALQEAARADGVYGEILAKRGWDRPGGGAARIENSTDGFSGEVCLRRLPRGETEVVAWNPSASPLYEHLGDVAARHEVFDAALHFYQEAFLRQGQEALHRICLSRLALARGSEEEAVASLRRAVEADPTSLAARVALGFECQSQGFMEEALMQFEVAARLKPGYADVQHNLGLLYTAQGRLQEAVQCLRRALDENPRYFQARTSLVQLLIRRREYETALQEVTTLMEQGLRSADLHAQRAEIHLAMNEARKAVEDLEAAVALNPSYARSYYILGRVYRELGLPRKARSAWQQFLERSRDWREQHPVFHGEE